MTDEEKVKLKSYSKSLDNLARIKSKDVFLNRDHQHAAIVLTKILKYSKGNFFLFDDDLKGDIVNNDLIASFKNAVIEFISRGGNIKIVISDKHDGDDFKLKEFLTILTELFPKQVELKLASPAFKESMWNIFKEKINFAIGDDNKYRLELFGDNSIENRTRTAKGSFNDEKTACKLLSVFNSNYNNCFAYN